MYSISLRTFTFLTRWCDLKLHANVDFRHQSPFPAAASYEHRLYSFTKWPLAEKMITTTHRSWIAKRKIRISNFVLGWYCPSQKTINNVNNLFWKFFNKVDVLFFFFWDLLANLMSGWGYSFHTLHISGWGLPSEGCQLCVQCRNAVANVEKSHGNSQCQLFAAVAWHDECLSQTTMDRAWPQHLNIEAQAAKTAAILAAADF